MLASCVVFDGGEGSGFPDRTKDVCCVDEGVGQREADRALRSVLLRAQADLDAPAILAASSTLLAVRRCVWKS
eukprot:35672-Rhodomonas_salina.1